MRVEVEPGVELAVQDLGGGRPVVLIAGFGMSHDAWDGQVRLLAEAGHRVVCIDLRGTGDSDKPLGGYEVERMTTDVIAVLDSLNLSEVTLVGWSFGAQVSFRAVARAPERIVQLVIVASNAVRASRGDGFAFGHTPDQLEAPIVKAELADRAAARRQTIASGFADQPAPDTLDWLVSLSMRMPSWAAVATYRAMFHTDLMADLPKVKLPVLQIVGSDDPVLSIKGARWLEEQLADSRLVELERSGHFPMLEAPQVFDAALLEFVADGPASK